MFLEGCFWQKNGQDKSSIITYRIFRLLLHSLSFERCKTKASSSYIVPLNFCTCASVIQRLLKALCSQSDRRLL